ncbi:hypothetical protein [Tianweitania sediminis]|nr:hypothetical protein [Tianweitania sediminis]
MTRRKVGRVKIAFEKLEQIAADRIEQHPLFRMSDGWTLSRKSSVTRCKDGSLTLSLIWKANGGKSQLMETIRGIRPGEQ